MDLKVKLTVLVKLLNHSTEQVNRTHYQRKGEAVKPHTLKEKNEWICRTNKKGDALKPLVLVPKRGFEPPTYYLRNSCSTN